MYTFGVGGELTSLINSQIMTAAQNSNLSNKATADNTKMTIAFGKQEADATYQSTMDDANSQIVSAVTSGFTAVGTGATAAVEYSQVKDSLSTMSNNTKQMSIDNNYKTALQNRTQTQSVESDDNYALDQDQGKISNPTKEAVSAIQKGSYNPNADGTVSNVDKITMESMDDQHVSSAVDSANTRIQTAARENDDHSAIVRNTSGQFQQISQVLQAVSQAANSGVSAGYSVDKATQSKDATLARTLESVEQNMGSINGKQRDNTLSTLNSLTSILGQLGQIGSMRA
jgi:hypothetical protein